MSTSRRGLLLVVLALLSLPSLLATNWTPSTFPNPNVDISACGRNGVASSICDPDGILPYESANIIEAHLNGIAAGRAPFETHPCGSAGPRGYQVAVALMRSFQQLPGEPPDAGAARMAKSLHNAWGVGSSQCGDGVLLLVAFDLHTMYVSTGTAAAQVLTYDVLGRILDKAKPLMRAQQYDKAVEQLVLDIGLCLAGQEIGGGDSGKTADTFPWIGAGVVSMFVGVVGYTRYQKHREKKRYKRCKSILDKLKEDQAAVQANAYNPTSCPVCLEDYDDVGKLHKEARADSSAAEPSSTQAVAHSVEDPLLRPGMGSADPGVGGGSSQAAVGKKLKSNRPARRALVMPCGHSFCEPCISTWLKTHVTCPVCRTPIDRHAPPSHPPSHPPAPAAAYPGGYYDDDAGFGDHRCRDVHDHSDERRRRSVERGRPAEWWDQELLFRLQSLQRMYPAFVTPIMLDTWADDIRHHRALDMHAWQSFVMTDPAVRAANAERGSGGAECTFGGGAADSGRGGSW